MPRTLARGILARYPRLRSTWPVSRVQEWRERQSWRAHPRRMASWYREADDMRTRLFVSNLEVPEAPALCRRTTVVVRLFDQEGVALAARPHLIERNASLALELR